MLYLLTSGSYSDYGIVELLDGPEVFDWGAARLEWNSTHFTERQPDVPWPMDKNELWQAWYARKLAHYEANGSGEWGSGFALWLCNHKGFTRTHYVEVCEDDL